MISLTTKGPSTYDENFKLVDQFGAAYWSGLDCALYCGDLWIDDALQFGCQGVEQVNPYYGYASFSVDRMQHGVRIYTGEFTINFKHANYIYAVLDEINRSGVDRFGEGETLNLPINYNPAVAVTPPVTSISSEDQVKSMVDYAKGFQKLQAAKELSASRVLDNTRDFTPRTNGAVFAGPRRGFELIVLFGSTLNNSQYIDYDGRTRPTSPTGGQLPGPATGIKLVGVSITGSSIMINDSGQPIMETYNFMARNLIPLTGADIFGYTRPSE